MSWVSEPPSWMMKAISSSAAQLVGYGRWHRQWLRQEELTRRERRLVDSWKEKGKEREWMNGMERQAAEENFVFLCGRQWNGMKWTEHQAATAARQVHQLNFFSFLHKRRKEVRVEWKSFLLLFVSHFFSLHQSTNQRGSWFVLIDWRKRLILFHWLVMSRRLLSRGPIPLRSSHSSISVPLGISLLMKRRRSKFDCLSFFNNETKGKWSCLISLSLLRKKTNNAAGNTP